MRTKRNNLTKRKYKLRSTKRVIRNRQTRRRHKKGGQFRTPDSKIDRSKIPFYNGDPGLDTPTSDYKTPKMRGITTPNMYPGDPGLDTPDKSSPRMISKKSIVRKLFTNDSTDQKEK
jgi:hypothetical protein